LTKWPRLLQRRPPRSNLPRQESVTALLTGFQAAFELQNIIMGGTYMRAALFYFLCDRGLPVIPCTLPDRVGLSAK
jgi:hypothetical protein